MKDKLKNKGSVFVIAIFTIAMLATLTIGILQINAEEIRLVQNQVWAAEALALAEAGLSKAMAEIRNDRTWLEGLSEVPTGSVSFGSGHYSIGYRESDGFLIISAQVSDWQGYSATIEAQVTVTDQSPHIIRIDNMRINEYSAGQ